MSFKLILIFASLFFIQTCFSQTSDPLKLHGGPVMDQEISLHFLFYGSWSKSDEEVQMLQFVGPNIAASDWFQISRCMEDSQGNPITNHVDLPDNFFYTKTSKFGTTFNTQADVEVLLQAMIPMANLLLDPNDIYVLITSDEIETDIACNSACGFHYYINNTARIPIKYMLISSGGGVNSCPGCALNINGPWGALTNQLVNTFVHTLVNTVSDPVPFTGWYDPEVVEAASKCTTQFPLEIPFLPNKNVMWNVVLSDETGSEKHWFLIQGNWDIISNTCRIYPYSDCSVIAPSAPLESTAHNPSSASMMTASLSILVSTLFAFVLLF